ncbi:hypothetical protein X759_25590 [Mesorhizobium sp. LSHC420B00]|nr:hypothetical protein X759_25590 [Mesorhizobium sp. LSHC420B00]
MEILFVTKQPGSEKAPRRIENAAKAFGEAI